MRESGEQDRAIHAFLLESGFEDDARLGAILQEIRAQGEAVRPLPSAAVAGLMRTAPRHRVRGHRRYVVGVIVGATVLAGGAAAASPLLHAPDAATVFISGLLGTPAPASEPSTTEASRPSEAGRQGGEGPSPAPTAPPAEHPSGPPVAVPGNPHIPALPVPAQTHPSPDPAPTPRSTHARQHTH